MPAIYEEPPEKQELRITRGKAKETADHNEYNSDSSDLTDSDSDSDDENNAWNETLPQKRWKNNLRQKRAVHFK